MFNVGNSNITDGNLHLEFVKNGYGTIYEPSYKDADGNNVQMVTQENGKYKGGILSGTFTKMNLGDGVHFTNRQDTEENPVEVNYTEADFDEQRTATTFDTMAQSMDMLKKLFGNIFCFSYNSPKAELMTFDFKISDYEKCDLRENFENLNTASIAFFGGTFLDLSTGYVTLNKPEYANPIKVCKIADLFRAIEDANYTDEEISDRISDFIATRLTLGVLENPDTPDDKRLGVRYRNYFFENMRSNSAYKPFTVSTLAGGEMEEKYQGSYFAYLVKIMREAENDIKNTILKANRHSVSKEIDVDSCEHLVTRFMPIAISTDIDLYDYGSRTSSISKFNFFDVSSPEYSDYMRTNITNAMNDISPEGKWMMYAAWVELLRKSLMLALTCKQKETNSAPENYRENTFYKQGATNSSANGEFSDTMYTSLITSLNNGANILSPYNWDTVFFKKQDFDEDTYVGDLRDDMGAMLFAGATSDAYMFERSDIHTPIEYDPFIGSINLMSQVQEASTEAIFIGDGDSNKPNLGVIIEGKLSVVDEATKAFAKCDVGYIMSIRDKFDNKNKKRANSYKNLSSPINPIDMEFVQPGVYNDDIISLQVEQGTEMVTEFVSLFSKDLYRVIKMFVDSYRKTKNW